MPVYDYACDTCGVFTVLRPMAQYQEPHDCPGCGVSAPRAMVTAPRLAGMDNARRAAFATNERAAHAPQQSSGHIHGASCGCGSPSAQSGAAKTFPSARPWMISH
jgi:putative FmdB family regulatory protein